MLKIIIESLLLVLLTGSGFGSAFADESRFTFFDMTVEDKHSGLIWTRDARLGQRDWDGAFVFVNELNRTRYAGFNDWRLPNKEQLMTLSTYAHSLEYKGIDGTRTPAGLFNQIGFYKVAEDCYWSSNNDIFEIKFAWCVYMGDGSLSNPNKYVKSYIWPVRGGR